MRKSHKIYADSLKGKVALEAVKSDRTIAEIGQEYDVPPSLVAQWKKHLLTHVAELFVHGNAQNARRLSAQDLDPLYTEIGKLKMENELLKKKL